MKSTIVYAIGLATLLTIQQTACVKTPYQAEKLPTANNIPGTVRGKVCDSRSGKPVPGAVIQLDSTATGTLADPNGQYEIFRVPPGTYTLRAYRYCFGTAFVTELVVRPNKRTTQNVNLEWLSCKENPEVVPFQFLRAP
jgi:hypothetical protein